MTTACRAACDRPAHPAIPHLTTGRPARADILTLDDDLRGLPLSMRKTNLARLLARRPDGIFAAPFEHGEIGPDLFRAACDMGLEGLVSKRRDRPYQAGRSKHWVKIKNRKHPAMSRVMEASQ